MNSVRIFSFSGANFATLGLNTFWIRSVSGSKIKQPEMDQKELA